MLTLKDCLAMCDLTEEEILAIAEHEHMPEMCAAELGQYLVHSDDGCVRIERMILDDIGAAEARGDRARALNLKTCLVRFCKQHLGRDEGEKPT